MKHRPTSRRRRSSTRSVLRLLDLEHSKTAVLNSLTSQDAQRGYRHAIDEFVDWYCSEPRLAFNRIVVLRYRSHLESRQLAPGTVNLRLGAVRRLAYEAADCGLLSADLAAGIRRVKGVKKLGVRLGNWLTAEQGQVLWQAPDCERLKGKRDRALLALLLACGLRRHEAVALTLGHLQQREEHWAIVDLMGKGGHVRTVPVPDWVRSELEVWLAAAGIDRGKLFRRVNKVGRAWGNGMTVKGVWHVWCSVLLFRHRPRPEEDPASQCDAKSPCTLGCTAIARSLGLPTAAPILATRPRRKVCRRGAFGCEGHGKRANSHGLSQSVAERCCGALGGKLPTRLAGPRDHPE